MSIQLKQSSLAKTRLFVSLTGGVIARLFIGNMVGWSKVVAGNGGSDRTKNTVYPTAVPYITTESQCEKRTGAVWADGKCLDFEQDPSF